METPNNPPIHSELSLNEFRALLITHIKNISERLALGILSLTEAMEQICAVKDTIDEIDAQEENKASFRLESERRFSPYIGQPRNFTKAKEPPMLKSKGCMNIEQIQYLARLPQMSNYLFKGTLGEYVKLEDVLTEEQLLTYLTLGNYFPSGQTPLFELDDRS